MDSLRDSLKSGLKSEVLQKTLLTERDLKYDRADEIALSVGFAYKVV